MRFVKTALKWLGGALVIAIFLIMMADASDKKKDAEARLAAADANARAALGRVSDLEERVADMEQTLEQHNIR